MITRMFDSLSAHLPLSFRRHREEAERITRFILIGGLTFVFNAALYAFISRIIWPQGNRSLENFFTTVVTSILNYLAHRAWTFRSQGAHTQQALRYFVVALSAIALQSGLFWIGYRVLQAHDFTVIFVVALLIPFYTYLAHKLFTFREAHVLS